MPPFLEGITVGRLDETGAADWAAAFEAKVALSSRQQPPELHVINKGTGEAVLQLPVATASVSVKRWLGSLCRCGKPMCSDVLRCGEPALAYSSFAPAVWSPSRLVGLLDLLLARPLFETSSFPQATTNCILRCSSPLVGEALQQLVDQALEGQRSSAVGNGHAPPVAAGGCKLSLFERKTDKSSAEIYFNYYGMLQHQQNMLQDYTRTGTYYSAITENRPDFEGKTVMDVGAGSGILSLFAVQAGASKVFAVEASGMSKYARLLADSNPELGARIHVITGKVEEIAVGEKVDVLISEPMGTLLVNERMIETYLYARDHFLKPGGKMFPQIGRIHVAAFSDEILYNEVLGKAYFWVQPNFYGVDVTSLYGAAVDSYFAQVVVDSFDPCVLVSSCNSKIFDFLTITEESLHDISVPLQLQVTTLGPCAIHGVACWFDVFFNGSHNRIWLSTAPGQPATHWFQIRCVLKVPVFVPGPCTLTGHLQLTAHNRQSYTVNLSLQGPPLQPGQPAQVSEGSFDLKEPYYRQLNAVAFWQQPQTTAQ